MANVVFNAKPLTVNPLKVSQPMGATLAFLGMARTMPLMHSGLGCTAFSKVFFTRHFREPIPLQTTAMDLVSTIAGGDANLQEALDTIASQNAPDIIGLVTTGLSETQGADIHRAVRLFRDAHPHHNRIAVVPVNSPDTLGTLETGFALAVEGAISTLVPESAVAGRQGRQVNVLASSMLTPGDVEAVKEWVAAFGLTAVVLPDLSESLDGRLTPDGYSALTTGGVTRGAIAGMGASAATLVIGPSLKRAGVMLEARTGVPTHTFPGLMGLEDCDAFTHTLARIARVPVPAALERQRAQLQDAMVDCQFLLGSSRLALAADPDLLGSLSRFLTGMGAEIVAAVTSGKGNGLSDLPVETVTTGDLEDLERLARAGRAGLVLSNSHASETAARLGVPLFHAGFPQYDRVGGYARTWVGYRGARQVLFDLANTLAARIEAIAPYRSIFWDNTARAAEMVEPC